jgi:hypothetical protein
MAGFYSILSKGIDALDPNTPDARRRLYERATAALVAEMRGPDPALSRSEFQAAWTSLKEAIVRIEREIDAKTETAAETPAAHDTQTEVAADAELPADTNMATEAHPEPAAHRHRPIPRQTTTPATAPPRAAVAAAPVWPALRLAGQRRPRLMGFLTRAFRRDPDAAPRHAARAAGGGEELSDIWSELASAQASDKWLSDLLARASRDDHETRKKRT